MKKILILIGIFLYTIQNIYSQQSLNFVENQGQWKEDFLFKSYGSNADFYLEPDGYTVLLHHPDNAQKIHDYKYGHIEGAQTLQYHAYKMKWLHAKKPSKVSTEKPEPYAMNFLLGNDPSRWKSNIYPVKNVEYTQIYDGINVRISSSQGNPKYDYIVAPHAQPSKIQLQYQGLEEIDIKDGKLILHNSIKDISELAPYAYQYINNERVEVPCEYKKLDANTIGFVFPKGYNESLELIIDPEIVFASLTGSTSDNWGFTATYDAAGNLYAGGIVNGAAYPTSVGAFQTTFGGGSPSSSMPCDVSIMKFNSSGTTMMYSTLIGGNADDMPHSMVVDPLGNLVISGKTQSSNFPTTTGAYDVTHNGGFDIFILKLNPTGTGLIASTYLGGSGNDGININASYSGEISTLKYNYGDNSRSEVLIDQSNNVYLAAASQSTNFPVTAAAAKTTLTGTQDGVIVKMNANLNTLLYSSYIGGINNDAAYVLAFDKNYSNVFVGGGTQSSDFMSSSTSGAYLSTFGGVTDGWITKFSNTATSMSIVRTTFIGTSSYDQVFGLQVDTSNNVYAMGQTLGAFPVSTGVYSNPGSSQFIIKLDGNLTSRIYSTVYGSGSVTRPNIAPVAFLVDTCENVYISGWGGSIISSTMSGMPITTDALQPTTDGNDFYFIVFKKDATALLYASYFGATGKGEHVDGGTSRFSPKGEVYQSMCASCGPGSSSYPATPGAYASTKGSSSTNCNIGVVKIAFNLGNVNAHAVPLPTNRGCAPLTINFENHSTNAETYEWSFGDGGSSTLENPSHTFTSVGTYTVRLIAKNDNGCTERDTTFITIVVEDKEINPNFNYTIIDSCDDYTVSFTNMSTSYSPTPFTTATYRWKFGYSTPDYIGVTPPTHAFPGPGTYTVTLIMTDPAACVSPDSIQKTITFTSSNVVADFDAPNGCMDETGSITFTHSSTNATGFLWDFGDGTTSTDANPTHSYSGVGTYTVRLIVSNPATCNEFDTAIRTVEIYPSPIAGFTYSPTTGELNQPFYFTNTSSGAVSYMWNFGDGTSSTLTNPSKQYFSTGRYNVCLTATNQYGCTDVFCRELYTEVLPLIDLPTAFTPNGDGSNDILFPRGFAVKEVNLQIFNRWGEKVFESNSMDNGWDGTYKGAPQPMEAYAYILSGMFEDGKSFKKQGNVTLIR